MHSLLFFFSIISIVAAGSLDCNFVDQYPRQYIAFQREKGDEITIDGNLDEKSWQLAKWSEPFVDIATPLPPPLSTHFKLFIDSEYLYIGAEIEETILFANISDTCHCNTTKEDQVIFHDDDFEVFIDCDGTTHNYKEFEINGKAATWDLLLNKPYGNGGFENSSRVFGPLGFDIPGQKKATRVIGGINNPSLPTKKWTVEIALPLSSLLESTIAPPPPSSSSPSSSSSPPQFWRINFSRVEWGVKIDQKTNKILKFPSCKTCFPRNSPTEDNWVWQAMTRVSMHEPERWGILQLSSSSLSSSETEKKEFDAEWRVRYMCSALYRAEHAFAQAKGGMGEEKKGEVEEVRAVSKEGFYRSEENYLRFLNDNNINNDNAVVIFSNFTTNLSDLIPFIEISDDVPRIVRGECTFPNIPPKISLTRGGEGFEIVVVDREGGWEGRIRDDRYLTVRKLKEEEKVF